MKKKTFKIGFIFLNLISSIIFGAFVGITFFEKIVINVSASNANIIVDYNGNGNYTKIQAAIDNATNGDTILVWAGIYYENIIINKSVTLIGNGTINTTINGSGIGDVIRISSDWVNITGFSIVNSGKLGGEPNYNSGIKLIHIENVSIYSNTCTNNKHGIFIINSNLNIIKNNTCNSNNANGIFLYNSQSNILENNLCNSNKNSGIYTYLSNYNKIINNTCNSNKFSAGIDIGSSNNNIISNNTVILNKGWGIRLLSIANWNIIKNNICNFNDNGIEIYTGDQNIILNNTCSNSRYGVILYSNSKFNFVNKNNCYNNTIAGIMIAWNSTFNNITNNSCINNKEGFIISDSSSNNINNNSCNSNIQNGLRLYIDHWEGNFNRTEFNTIENNTIINNSYGINFEESELNIIKQNIISNNSNGIKISNLNLNNLIFKNIISNNTNLGISIGAFAKNYLYHNHILFNKNQASDIGNNYWNNSAQEGNYWSDYTGTDTGGMTYGWDITNKHQIAGDGIGDTKVPHLNLDYYPFTNRLGWLKPGTPILEDPGELDNDGNYNLSWNTTVRTVGYVLEEDCSSSFDSPTKIYNGSSLIFNISKKINGTYYYRVKAYNEKYESPWSNIVDIIMDWLPVIPKNLSASTYPPGNTLNLTWDLNQIDTNQYILQYKNETMADWQQLDPIIHPGNTLNHIELVDGERYDYRIQAQDHRGQVSNFSEMISGIPWDSLPPAPPTGLRVDSTTNESIYLAWSPNTEDDLEGYHIFRSEFESPANWGKPIGSTIKGTEQYLDTSLEEEQTYYYVLTAFDEVPNNSNFSDPISGTTIFGQYAPIINNSQEDFSIMEDTIDYSTIKLHKWFMDINNDLLEFKCKGQNNLSVTIFQENGTVILIPKRNWNGQETLTFYANDSVYEISDNVTITVTPVNDPPGPAIIITPDDGFEVDNGTVINFSAICYDVDLIYGDILTFNWSSNISGIFGSGENLSNIILTPGHHQITVKVTDIANEIAMDITNITILPEVIQNNNGKSDNNITLKFELDFSLIPNKVFVNPGESTSIRAVVTNLGNVSDNISINIINNDTTTIKVNVNGSSIREIGINGKAEFEIIINIPTDIEPGVTIFTVQAVSENAKLHEFVVVKNATLIVNVSDDTQKNGSNSSTENVWFYLLAIIIILILILIFIMITKRKKKGVDKPPPEEVETIKPSDEPPAVITLEEKGETPAPEAQETLEAPDLSDETKLHTESKPEIGKKIKSDQLIEPQQVPMLPPTEESMIEQGIGKEIQYESSIETIEE